MRGKKGVKLKTFRSKQNIAVIVVAALIAVAAILTIFLLMQPERSVAAYCKVHKEQSAKLAHAQGDTYSVTVFPHSSSDPGDFVSAFNELEQVAPEEIYPDVKTLQQIFQTINDDPSQAFGASLSGLSAESSVKEWTVEHCSS